MMTCDKIVDLRTYSSINNSKAFFLDTNILYWYTYPRFSLPGQLSSSAKIYYDFVDSLTAAGNPLFTSVYNLSELLNVIEKNEYDIYCKTTPGIHITRKDFRKIFVEREKVKQMMQTSLNNAKQVCTVSDFNFSTDSITKFVDTLLEHRCDIFDYEILLNCIQTNCLNIISDDSDFSTMEKIVLYTANEKILPNRK